MSETPGVAGAATPSASDLAARTPVRLVALTRGLPALTAGLITTFTGAHSPAFGLMVFGVWALVDAVFGAVLLLTRRALAPDGPLAVLRVFVVAAGGIAALVLAALSAGAAGSVALVLVIGLTALLAGGADVARAARARRGIPIARDLALAGGITLLLGVAALAIPPGLDQPFHGAPGHPGVLTASTVETGLFGAWGIVTGVLWTIAAVGPAPRVRVSAAAGSAR